MLLKVGKNVSPIPPGCLLTMQPACALMLTDQVSISGGMAQVSSQLRSNFRCFGSIPASEGYGFQVGMHEAGRTCSLKLPVPVQSVFP